MKAWGSTARPSRASRASRSPTWWPCPTPRPSPSCRPCRRTGVPPACSATSFSPTADPTPAIPAYALKRMLAKAADLGYTMYVGPELEFFYFKDSSHTEVLDRGGYFDLTSLDVSTSVRRDTVTALEDVGIEVEYAHHECGPSQHEIDLRYKDALHHGRLGHDLPAAGQRSGQRQRHPRHLHAQAHVR